MSLTLQATTEQIDSTSADTVVVGIFEDAGEYSGFAGSEVAELVASGEFKGKLKQLALTRLDGKRVVAAGLGKQSELTTVAARELGALVQKRCGELSTKELAAAFPEALSEVQVGAFAEGVLLASYSFTEFKSEQDEDSDDELSSLTVYSKLDLKDGLQQVSIVSKAQNFARDLQNAPSNVLTPSELAKRTEAAAKQIAGLEVDVKGGDQIRELKMGAFAAVAQGSVEDPKMIVMRYSGKGAPAGKRLGIVGKAVTFDTGGISIKPSPKMEDMKFDMSGGATAIAATLAIAELGLPVDLITVVGATENMPDGKAVKPGDIVTAMNGTTIEVNNTDAEGRLVLADCLSYAAQEGATELIDLATLTGAIIISLGSTYAGLISSSDELSERIEGSADRTDELVWRLPLHEDFAEAMRGQFADLHNVNNDRKAGSITAGEFLKHFTNDLPWAHLDIAGVSWDLGKPQTEKGGSGFGVRLLVDVARV